jgi:hypothetical protein
VTSTCGVPAPASGAATTPSPCRGRQHRPCRGAVGLKKKRQSTWSRSETSSTRVPTATHYVNMGTTGGSASAEVRALGGRCRRRVLRCRWCLGTPPVTASRRAHSRRTGVRPPPGLAPPYTARRRIQRRPSAVTAGGRGTSWPWGRCGRGSPSSGERSSACCGSERKGAPCAGAAELRAAGAMAAGGGEGGA